VTASFGVAIYPDHADSVKELISKADSALYIAKKTGRDKTVLWNESLDDLGSGKDTKPVFLTGDISKDSLRTQSLLRITKLAQMTDDRDDNIKLALDEMLTITGASDVSYLVLEKGDLKNIHRLSQPDHSQPPYNYSLITSVIANPEPISLIDWNNENLDMPVEFSDWQSLAIVPALFRSELRGIIYASVSIKRKEFKAEDLSYFINAATILASMNYVNL